MEQGLAWSTVTWPQTPSWHPPHCDGTKTGISEGAPAGHWVDERELHAKQAPVSSGVIVAPVPLRETFWGLPAASSAIESVPFTSPEPSGVKVTRIVQMPNDGTPPTQLLVSAKLLLVVILEMFNAMAP